MHVNTEVLDCAASYCRHATYLFWYEVEMHALESYVEMEITRSRSRRFFLFIADEAEYAVSSKVVSGCDTKHFDRQ